MSRDSGAFDTIRRGLALSPEIRRYVPVAVGMGFVATFGRVITPIVIQQVLDRGILGDEVRLGFTFSLLAVAAAASLLAAVASGVMQMWAARMSESALSGLRTRTFRHIHNLSALHQSAERRGSLVARVTSDIDQVSHFMEWASLLIIVSLGQGIVAVVVMFVYSVPLALTALAFVPLLAVMVRWFQSRLETAYMRVREAVADMSATLAETVTGAAVIRAYGVEDHVRKRLGNRIETHRSTGMVAARLSSTFSGVAEIVAALVVATTVVVGTVFAAQGRVSAGTVVAFLFLVQLFVDPIGIVGEAVNEAQTAVAGWRRVLDVLDITPDVADPGDDGVELPTGPLAVHFAGVSFRYPNPGETSDRATGTRALSGVDVTIAANSNVAVVGETGSGKTTFAKLIVRLMDATSGTVTIGGVDVRRIRFDSLRGRVAMVPQEGALFRGTIGDNVAMGRSGVTPSEVAETFDRLGLSDWLEEMAAGLDTAVGDRGSALSVGERQLVTLVRAAIADPELLVLDEATSSVDPETEVRIGRALRRLATDRTVVTIAHRLSTAETSDRVLVFDQGRIVQDGTHPELVGQPGTYQDLHRAWRRGAVHS